MDFTFARATGGRAVFAVFASPDERVRRDQRDAARFRSPRSSRARSKVVALGNRTVVTGAGSFPTITRPTLFTCERFGMSLDTWQRQERAFGLLKKVYAKRAKLRGEQPSVATAPK
jgi:hypothetical protein